jgi:hypothetical protein
MAAVHPEESLHDAGAAAFDAGWVRQVPDDASDSSARAW